VKCHYCGRDEPLPFRCQYCQGFFCSEHRLPENHACPEGWRARASREETPQTIKRGRSPYEYTVTYTPIGLKPRRFWFSQTELRHLSVSALLVMGVGITWVLLLALERGWILPTEILLIMAFAFTCVFLFHEIAHKIVAQHYGLWAEFRLFFMGALLTLLSIVSPIKFISPGAVMIAGSASKDVVGKTAVAGPLTNIVLSLLSLAVGSLLEKLLSFQFFSLAMLIVAFNAWVALVNLIPIGMLDGLKVFKWNKVVWGVVFVLSVTLTVLTFNYVFTL